MPRNEEKGFEMLMADKLYSLGRLFGLKLVAVGVLCIPDDPFEKTEAAAKGTS